MVCLTILNRFRLAITLVILLFSSLLNAVSIQVESNEIALSQHSMSARSAPAIENEEVISKDGAITSSAVSENIVSSSSGSGERDERTLSTYEQVYIQQNCRSDSFHKVVLLQSDESLWDVVKQYIDESGEHFSFNNWIDFSRTPGAIWQHRGNPSRGVLVLLPPGKSYITENVSLSYRYRQPNDDGDYIYIAPRIGLCALPGNSPATLILRNKGLPPVFTGTDLVFGDNGLPIGVLGAPLFLEQTQLELYGINLACRNVHGKVAGIELREYAKLILSGVTMSRSGKVISDLAGLIQTDLSTVIAEGSDFIQRTNKGVSLDHRASFVSVKNSRFIVGGSTSLTYSERSDLRLKNNQFHSESAASPETAPVAIFSAFTDVDDDCEASQYFHCQKQPEDWVSEYFMNCQDYIRRVCQPAITHYSIKGNIFSGNWHSLLRAHLDIFSDDSTGNEVTTPLVGNRCATEGSNSLSGDLRYNSGKFCLMPNAQTGTITPTSTSTSTSTSTLSLNSKPVVEESNSVTENMSERLIVLPASAAMLARPHIAGTILGSLTALVSIFWFSHSEIEVKGIRN